MSTAANVGDTVPVGISFGDSAAAVAVAKVSDCLEPYFTKELHQRMCWMGMGWHGPNRHVVFL
jgi:hypothetical protein